MCLNGMIFIFGLGIPNVCELASSHTVLVPVFIWTCLVAAFKEEGLVSFDQVDTVG